MKRIVNWREGLSTNDLSMLMSIRDRTQGEGLTEAERLISTLMHKLDKYDHKINSWIDDFKAQTFSL